MGGLSRYRWWVGAGLAIVAAFAAPVAAETSGAYVPTHLEPQITPLFFSDDYAALEKMVEPLRDASARTPSGQWLLTDFYETFNGNFLAEHSVGDYPDGFMWKKLDAWTAAFPASPTPHILRAIAMTNLARLSSQSHIVTSLPEAGWQPYLAYARDARDTLVARPGLGQQDPHYFVPLIRLMAFTGVEIQDLLITHAEATERWPLYDAVHIEAMEHLAVLSHHSERVLQGFANTVHAASSPLRGDETYARLMDAFSRRVHGLELFATHEVRWGRMRTGLARIIDSHPSEENKQRLALYACLAGDRKTASAAFQSAANKAVRSVWRQPQVYGACRKWSVD